MPPKVFLKQTHSKPFKPIHSANKNMTLKYNQKYSATLILAAAMIISGYTVVGAQTATIDAQTTAVPTATTVPTTTATPAPVTFPVAQLGNCTDKESCRAYEFR
jgi:hypothetical protein